ncbi:Uncharacterised protein [uncultured archaeon]|nr:Uncharacterised protein [uncultured archaeon]
MYNLKEAYSIAEKIPGWLACEEAEYLYNVGYNSNSDILEIGTYFGKSTYLMAQGIKDANKKFKVITIDIHWRGIDPNTNKPIVLSEDSQIFIGRVLKEYGLENTVIQMIGWSDICISFIDFNKIKTIFIDCGHDYESCSKDFLTIRKKLTIGRNTNLLFHDYHPSFPGVQKTIDELVKNDPGFKYVNLIHSLFICELEKSPSRYLQKIFDKYHYIFSTRERKERQNERKLGLNQLRYNRYGNRKAEISDIQLKINGGTGENAKIINFGDNTCIQLKIQFHEDAINPIAGYIIRDIDGREVYNTNTLWNNLILGEFKKNDTFEISFLQRMILNNGLYFITVALAYSDAKQLYDWHDNVIEFEVKNNKKYCEIVDLQTEIKINRVQK